MSNYIIHELQNLNSVRAGHKYEGTLRGAKMAATKNQAWSGTILKICDANGSPVAIKDVRTGEWYDPQI